MELLEGNTINFCLVSFFKTALAPRRPPPPSYSKGEGGLALTNPPFLRVPPGPSLPRNNPHPSFFLKWIPHPLPPQAVPYG